MRIEEEQRRFKPLSYFQQCLKKYSYFHRILFTWLARVEAGTNTSAVKLKEATEREPGAWGCKWAIMYLGYRTRPSRLGESRTWDRGRGIAQAVSRWLPTATARVRARVWSCGICGGQSGAGAGFLRALRFPLPIFIPPTAPQSPSSVVWGLYNRPEVAAVPSGLSPTPLIK
jgi:hypothetical protein